MQAICFETLVIIQPPKRKPFKVTLVLLDSLWTPYFHIMICMNKLVVGSFTIFMHFLHDSYTGFSWSQKDLSTRSLHYTNMITEHVKIG